MQSLRDALFGEPRGGRLRWASLVFGGLLLLVSLLARYTSIVDSPFSLAFVVMGLYFLLSSTAELLPTDRRRLAASFRVGALASLLLFLVLWAGRVITP